MQIFNNKASLNNYLSSLGSINSTIGFVPTMGALHNGHLSLLKKSLENNSVTVVSIFVNPTQFNNQEDLAKYPRTLDNDVEKVKSVSDKIVVYAPTVDDIYDGNTTSIHYNFDGLENQMEGKFRPGHFDGVGTVVKKLFEIIKPTNAYFGEKDFQQLQIVRKLTTKYKLPVTIVGCEIFRESNGLAMSSRNERLSIEDRNEASLIYKTLLTAKELFGTKTANEVSKYVINVFKNQSKFELEYFEIADEQTLKTCKRKSEIINYRAFIAVFVNNVRLIDTISL
ncbi:pantoate--beta-alanine ligase [Flavobacterium sp.]|uniref:pantoate--beta-alanine ligase n=1 Tax=Flavobacterium sp. TaxID=239 RepID=UPI003750E430